MHYLPATTADARKEKTDARLHKIAEAVTLLEEGARRDHCFRSREIELIEDLEVALDVGLAISKAFETMGRSRALPHGGANHRKHCRFQPI